MNSTTPYIQVRRVNKPTCQWERTHPIEISGGWLSDGAKLNLSDAQVRLLGGMLAVIRDGWSNSRVEEWPIPTTPPQSPSHTETQ